MAVQMSTYFANAILSNLFQGNTFVWPNHLYFALCTATPLRDSTGSSIVEPSGAAAYARAQLDPSPSNWRTPLIGRTWNLANIAWPAPTGAWGTILALAVLDAATAGNVLLFGPFNQPFILASPAPQPILLPATCYIQ